MASAANGKVVSEQDKTSLTNGSIPRTRSQIFAEVTEKSNVPVLFREPHVETGFRQINQPWKCYLFSIFQVHNECMNVWTHLIALVMVLYKTWHYSYEHDFIGDPHMWPFAFLIVTTVILYLCSSGAHCLQNKSELTHYTCFMIDYAGIGFYSFGCVVAHYYYCTEKNFYDIGAFFYVQVGALLAVNVCLCNVLGKAIYSRPYPPARRLMQILSVGTVYLWLNSPITIQLYNCYVHDYKCDESVPFHSAQVAWFVTSAFFFASDIPQRFFPGKFDFIGHSHQLFHICILMTTYCQFEAVIIDIAKDHADLKSRPDPGLWGTFGYGFLVLICETAIVIGGRSHAKENKIKTN